MLIFQLLRKKNFRLEKIIFLPKKCIYFLTYRNEHPVHIRAMEGMSYEGVCVGLYGNMIKCGLRGEGRRD